MSDISDDTRAELVKLIAARKAAKKRKLSGTGTTTDVVTAAAAKVSVNKDAQKARRNDDSVAKEKRKKSRVTLGKIIDSIGTGTVARTASPHVSGLPKARKDTSSKKEKQWHLLAARLCAMRRRIYRTERRAPRYRLPRHGRGEGGLATECPSRALNRCRPRQCPWGVAPVRYSGRLSRRIIRNS